MGQNSIAAALGINSHVKGAKGNWLVCAEWVDDGGWKVNTVESVKVDGKIIKEDTFYKVKDGKFVEAYD
jgi:major membrane immunogen (membrane-anchored lipoprotein)